MRQTLKLITRKSQLALWQANHVKACLERVHPELDVLVMGVVTEGDQWLNSKPQAGGKGLFVKQLEEALLQGEADLAVHSLKDVPMTLPAGLVLTAFLEGGSPFDVLVSPWYKTLAALPEAAVVGTASLRRQAQLRRWRPDLQVRSIRGNVNTRLKKLHQGDYDALILAEAGLDRLELSAQIQQRFSAAEFLPAVGQGVIAVEVREKDQELRALLACLQHEPTAQRVLAERIVNEGLGGSCTTPLGIFAVVQQNSLWLRARVLSVDGQQCLEAEGQGQASWEGAQTLGEQVAARLLAIGALKILTQG